MLFDGEGKERILGGGGVYDEDYLATLFGMEVGERSVLDAFVHLGEFAHDVDVPVSEFFKEKLCGFAEVVRGAVEDNRESCVLDF